MPQISWNEVRDRAIRFSRDWVDAKREESDKQTFWNEFFDVFGIRRRDVALFESSVARVKGTCGILATISAECYRRFFMSARMIPEKPI